ncbi:MAG TPA: hypothetical protein DCE44_14800 [Verrucomicrobiales bacterium]|nr:hypothetical protein [Verrucomicrobiales bacterium]
MHPEPPLAPRGQRVVPSATTRVVAEGTRRTHAGRQCGHGDHYLSAQSGSYERQEVELEFVLGPRTGLSFDIGGITSVPEPTTWTLFGIGGLALGATFRRRTR